MCSVDNCIEHRPKAPLSLATILLASIPQTTNGLRANDTLTYLHRYLSTLSTRLSSNTHHTNHSITPTKRNAPFPPSNANTHLPLMDHPPFPKPNTRRTRHSAQIPRKRQKTRPPQVPTAYTRKTALHRTLQPPRKPTLHQQVYQPTNSSKPTTPASPEPLRCTRPWTVGAAKLCIMLPCSEQADAAALFVL